MKQLNRPFDAARGSIDSLLVPHNQYRPNRTHNGVGQFFNLVRFGDDGLPTRRNRVAVDSRYARALHQHRPLVATPPHQHHRCMGPIGNLTSSALLRPTPMSLGGLRHHRCTGVSDVTNFSPRGCSTVQIKSLRCLAIQSRGANIAVTMLIRSISQPGRVERCRKSLSPVTSSGIGSRPT